jgi:hypothetical protein
VNLLREGFSCSTLTFATLFTAIERRIATFAQGAGFSYRAFGGISARKQAQAWTSTIVGLSADSGFALASVGDGNCWQSSHTCLCSDIADHTINQATICSQRDRRHTNVDRMSANDSVQRSSGLDVVPRLRLCVIEANSERRKTAFQLDGTVLGTLSGIELGFDSSVDLNGESGLWKFVRTWSHAEVQNFCVVVQWLL